MSQPNDSALLPDKLVARRYGVHILTLSRWDASETLGFPRPLTINNRKYRRIAELEAWERARVVQRANKQTAA
jgi:hypothetical protein